MRHLKRTVKLNKTSSHRRCMIANMLKSLLNEGRIVTTVPKAKELRRHADRLVTWAKSNTLSSRRRVISKLMIQYNPLSSKQRRAAKQGDLSSYNTDRKVVKKLFDELSVKYTERQGGYTRIVRMHSRRGDGSPLCLIEYI